MPDARRIQEVCDKEEIRDLAMLYAQYVIEERVQLIPSLFTADGRVDFGAKGGPVIGRDALVQFYKASTETFGLVSNHVVEVDGDNAKGWCAMHSPWYRGESPGFGGCYRDIYRRDNGKWLFLSREFKILYGSDDLKAMFRPLW